MQAQGFVGIGLLIFQCCCFGVGEDNNEEFLYDSSHSYKKEIMAWLLGASKQNILHSDSSR